MSVWLDEKYIKQCGMELENFSEKKDGLYNFRCPYCGDSKKTKSKTRGYFYKQTKKDKYSFKCHNCGMTSNVYGFLEEFFPSLFQSYNKERLMQKHLVHKSKDSEPIITKETPQTQKYEPKNCILENHCTQLSKLDPKHLVRRYVASRRLPDKFLKDLYYCEKFRELAIELNPKYEYSLRYDEQRLVFPLRTTDGYLFGVNGRAIDPKNKIRYMTLRRDSYDDQKFYGLERYNFDSEGYVVEGPFDSMFLPNCLAVCGSSAFTMEETPFDPNKTTIVLDNEPRNPDIVRNMSKLLNRGFRVCIWSKEFSEYKDINEAILDGYSSSDIQEMIEKNTYTGLLGLENLRHWKRC